MSSTTSDAAPVSPEASGAGDGRHAVAARAFLAVVPLLISLFYLWQVIKLPSLTRDIVVSPRAWPLIIACGMVLVSVVIAVGAVGGRWGLIGDGEREPLDRRDLLVTLAALLAFVVLYEPLGFLISGFGLITILSTLTSPRRWWRNALVAAGFVLVADVLFVQLLGVHLPPGILALPIW